MLAGTLEGRLLDEGPWLDVARSSDKFAKWKKLWQAHHVAECGSRHTAPARLQWISMVYGKLAGCIWEKMQRKRHYALIGYVCATLQGRSRKNCWSVPLSAAILACPSKSAATQPCQYDIFPCYTTIHDLCHHSPQVRQLAPICQMRGATSAESLGSHSQAGR